MGWGYQLNGEEADVIKEGKDRVGLAAAAAAAATAGGEHQTTGGCGFGPSLLQAIT